MKFPITILTLSFFLFGCNPSGTVKNSLVVTNNTELSEAISNAQPGDEIVLANGSWKDVQIRFTGDGTENQPITLRAETPGEVFIEGASDLKLGGSYLIVKGLHFKNGASPTSAVIEFSADDQYAFNCRVTECVIEGFNKSQRNKTDLWVQFKGRHNQLDHCYLAGKSNRGPTVRVDLAGNESIKNYHQIVNNHFGPRPPKGGPSAETIQIGNSSTSMVPSYTLVANNLFDECNGEVEVISSKSNFNEFRNNVFFKSEGSLVTRHGNYCILDGNYFIGDEKSPHIGGIRLIGTGHWVTNNYFYELRGKEFRSPLAVMNGIPKSPLNRYIQVTDVVVANNSWINCSSPWHFGVGSNVDQKDVLPASEIRSERPIRTTVANNLIYNASPDDQPIVAHDLLDGINFKSNVISNQGGTFDEVKGLESQSFDVAELGEYVFAPASDLSETEPFVGFEFESITNDLFGNPRKENNSIGAINSGATSAPPILDASQYGPSWYSAVPEAKEGTTHQVTPSSNDLASKLESAQPGDIIELAAGNHEITTPLVINKAINIRSGSSDDQALIQYSGSAGSPAFEMHPGGELKLENVALVGKGEQYAFAPLASDMSSLYNLDVKNCTIRDFDYILKAYKYSFAENISFTNSTLSNCDNGLELSEEKEDKGEYNAENIFIDNCQFDRIDQNVIDYYRGGYDESTVGGNLVLTNSRFSNCGGKERNGVLVNTYGIINVDISGNTFMNNRVQLVALLWGAKNNTHSDNKITNSGAIRVEQNLKLNLLY
ncbi:MAG: alginate lyase [Bacteroidia bacterium]|nr:alginate lyase [Bacteroidia bacterium]